MSNIVKPLSGVHLKSEPIREKLAQVFLELGDDLDKYTLYHGGKKKIAIRKNKLATAGVVANDMLLSFSLEQVAGL